MFDIPKTMRAVVYRGVNDLRLETVPVPRIGANELLVKVAVCGVCPTDIKKIQHGTVPPPRIFGHETAGTIVKMGFGVSRLGFGLKIGDRVALHHHVPCGVCHFCRHRAFAQCATYKRTGITAGFEPAGGGYAEFVRVMPFVLPGVVKILAKNSFEEGAMLEPVNTVLKAVRRLNLLPGDAVLVAGQGPIGLMFTKILQLQGIRVLATDLLESRLKLAKKFGAKWTRLGGTGAAPVVSGVAPVTAAGRTQLKPGWQSILPGEIRRDAAFDGRDARANSTSRVLDAAIIAVPSDDAVLQALQLVRGGGQVLLFAHTKRADQVGRVTMCAPSGGSSAARRGLTRPTAFALDPASICLDEKDLIGSYSSDSTLQAEVARLVFSRRLDVRGLISHCYPLEQTPAAIVLASRPAPDSLKILIRVH